PLLRPQAVPTAPESLAAAGECQVGRTVSGWFTPCHVIPAKKASNFEGNREESDCLKNLTPLG
ncbi:hypothetical protein, partial [Levilactobacillus hammesii]|uniref:hypothetical protein n=1 Tax=Levilactobacillus hammesii TaxID=267633 RepID=UPI001F37E679